MLDDEARSFAAVQPGFYFFPCFTICMAASILTLLLLCLQEFEPSPKGLGRAVTVGAFARDIMLDQVSGAPGTCAARLPLPQSAGTIHEVCEC
jgi:hypothetical protein